MATTEQAFAVELLVKANVTAEHDDIEKAVPVVNVNVGDAHIIPAIETSQVGIVEKPFGIHIEKPELLSLTQRQVSEHKSPDDVWIVIDNDVYDVTRFQHEHPGGEKVMAGVAGKDATKKFDKYHRRRLLEPYKPKLLIGTIVSDQQQPQARKGLFGKLGLGRK